jgi:lysophospholipase L1-like esterase
VKNRMALSTRVVAVLSILGVVAFVGYPGVSGASTKSSSANLFKGKYYISLGDSYSVGYQPLPSPGGATSGYTGYVAEKLKMNLENFGCGGATTTSILTYTGICGTGGSYSPPAATDVGPVISGDSQVQNAEAFIAANPGKVGLVTVSIGGNDVTACAAAASPVSCVEGVVSSIQSNVTSLVDDIRTSLNSSDDSSASIVGLTYPDVILGAWLYPDLPPNNAAGETLAGESQAAFQVLINPALKTAYDSVTGGSFVDVTAATGAYTPLTDLANLPKSTGITLPKHTQVPKAVVEVCKLTYYCTLGNIHANTKGYTEIGKLITKALK